MDHSNRNYLDYKMSQLENSLLDLSSMVEKAVDNAMDALKYRNHRQSQRVIAADRTLNARRYDVETDALSVLALDQPVVARDLRYVAAVMHIAGELERMGDYAKGIARISDRLKDPVPHDIFNYLEQMARKANQMLHAGMDAFIDRSVEQADKVANQDDELDELYNITYKALLAVMLDDKAMIDMATLLLWAAHNLERMGDRVTNICERIRFVETGQLADGPGFHDQPPV